LVKAQTFLGAISNSGKIAGSEGIAVKTVTVFGNPNAEGEITNSGTISALNTGVLVKNDATFLGSIINSSAGKIIAGQAGIDFSDGAVFEGGHRRRDN
jgi:hypothetical protein